MNHQVTKTPRHARITICAFRINMCASRIRYAPLTGEPPVPRQFQGSRFNSESLSNVTNAIFATLMLAVYPVTAATLLVDFEPGLQYYQQAHWFCRGAWQAWCISLHARAGDALVVLTGMRFVYALCSRERTRTPLYYWFWLLTWQVAMAAGLSYSFLAGDQRAYWSMQVITRMPAYLDGWLPFHMGTRLSWLLQGGSCINEATVARWRAFHLGYCLILLGHGLWWSTVRRVRLWTVRSAAVAALTALVIVCAARVRPEAPGAIANAQLTPSPVPVIWHQWPLMKLAGVCSPRQVMGIVTCALTALACAPLIPRKH